MTEVQPGRIVSLWLPVVACAALIFAFSSTHGQDTGVASEFTLRKLGHLVEYALLGALLVRALARPLPAFLLGVAYAVTDELHQHFVAGRHAKPVDVAIDAAGIAIGIVLYRRTRA